MVPGNDAILATCGPLARRLVQVSESKVFRWVDRKVFFCSSRDIVLFFDVVLKAQPWLQHMGLVPLPWKPENIKWTGKIRLGVMWDDGNVQPQPPVRRALKAMTEALKRTNKFDLVDYDPKFHKELVLMAVSVPTLQSPVF